MNKRIRSIIIEDELYDRQLIAKILDSYYAEYIEVVDSVQNAEEAIRAIKTHQPQLLFMDIELNGDRKGAFNILDKTDTQAKVIFVTAKSDQDDLLKAIKLSCIDYIVKPTKISDFEIPIKKAYEQINNAEDKPNHHMDLLRQNIDVNNIQEAKISLQEGFSYRPVAIKSIVRCASEGNYTQFYFTNSTHSLINGNLKSFEERLSAYGFCRITKTDLLNINQVRSFSRRSSSWELIMNDGSTLYISPSRKQEFLMRYNEVHLS